MSSVSVIIPTYNRADLLGQAIESVLAQTYQDVEILVADDGSNDNTAAVAKRYAGQIQFLALPHRGQPAAPRNAALAVATGDYIAFLDSDDLYLPHKLALQVPVLEANPQVGLVYSNAHFFDESPDIPLDYVQDGLPTPSGMVFADLLRGNFLSIPVVLIRRSCLQQAGGFSEDPDFAQVEDYDLWLRLAMQTEMLYVAGDVAAIRRHGSNLSANVLRHRLRIRKVYDKFEQLYPELMSRHAQARHEAYARNHGGIAQSALQQRQWGRALRHGGNALWHTLHLPALGTGVISAWWKRRRLRHSAQ